MENACSPLPTSREQTPCSSVYPGESRVRTRSLCGAEVNGHSKTHRGQAVLRVVGARDSLLVGFELEQLQQHGGGQKVSVQCMLLQKSCRMFAWSTCITGPKISSRQMVMSSETLARSPRR